MDKNSLQIEINQPCSNYVFLTLEDNCLASEEFYNALIKLIENFPSIDYIVTKIKHKKYSGVLFKRNESISKIAIVSNKFDLSIIVRKINKSVEPALAAKEIISDIFKFLENHIEVSKAVNNSTKTTSSSYKIMSYALETVQFDLKPCSYL